MKILAVHYDNTPVELEISQIRSIRAINQTQSEVTYYNGRKDIHALINESSSQIIENIRLCAGDKSSYGKPTFRVEYGKYHYHHKIKIMDASSNEIDAYLCAICGNMTEPFGSIVCDCSVELPYDGELLERKKGLMLTDQPVKFERRKNDSITFNRSGEMYGEYCVSDIKCNENDKTITGMITIKREKVPVFAMQAKSRKEPENKRYYWQRV